MSARGREVPAWRLRLSSTAAARAVRARRHGFFGIVCWVGVVPGVGVAAYRPEAPTLLAPQRCLLSALGVILVGRLRLCCARDS